MNKLSLYFLDEELFIDFPKNLQNLKEQISLYFKLTDALINCINLCYNNSDSKIFSIKNEEDFTSFLKKNICNLYLDIGPNFDIYEEYLKEKEGNGDTNDLKRLNELILKDEEYTKISPTKFKKEEDEIKEINKLMEELRSRKAVLESNKGKSI
jgi:regulator of sigma D